MTRPNYQLWVHEINENGGLLLGGKLYPVELVEYDDRSSSEEAVRAIERLVTQDYGFSQNTSTSITDRQPDLAGRWPLSFLLMGTATSYVQSLVDVLVEAREAGQIGDDVAMISVSDASASIRRRQHAPSWPSTVSISPTTGPIPWACRISSRFSRRCGMRRYSSPSAIHQIASPSPTRRRFTASTPDVFYVGVEGPFPVRRQRPWHRIEVVI